MQRSLTGHARSKRELLEQVLEADLDGHGVWKLRDLLAGHDRVNAILFPHCRRRWRSRRPDGLARSISERARTLARAARWRQYRSQRSSLISKCCQ